MRRKKHKLEKSFEHTHAPTDLEGLNGFSQTLQSPTSKIEGIFYFKKLTELEAELKQLHKT